jgi:hypothetical protein
VRQDNWKLVYNVEPGTIEMYDLHADPGERNDLAAVQCERAATLLRVAETFVLENALRSHDSTTVAPKKLNPVILERLRELGYTGGVKED